MSHASRAKSSAGNLTNRDEIDATRISQRNAARETPRNRDGRQVVRPLPKGHSAALFLAPQEQQEHTSQQSTRQRQRKNNTHPSRVMSRGAGQVTMDSVQLYFTKILLVMRKSRNSSISSSSCSSSRSSSLASTFDTSQLVDARCVNRAYLENLLESVFSIAENSLEINALLDVVVTLVLQAPIDNQAWNSRECLAHLLCDAAVELMNGVLQVVYPHAVVCYIVDAVEFLGVTKSVIEKLVELPWLSSNVLLRFRVSSINEQFHEEQKMKKKKSSA